MSRNLKALGLAMVAALALSGVAASAAQAAIHHVTVPSAPAVVTAKEESQSRFKITGGEHEVTCESTYEGTLPVVTNSSITVTPTYKKCLVDGFIPTIGETIDVNHCAFVFEGDTNAAGDAGVEIECAPENDITITYKIFGVTCTIHVTPQTVRGVHYTGTTNATTGKKDVTVKATVTGIKYHETKPEGINGCPNNFTGEDGEFTGEFTAEGFKHATGCTALTETAKTTPSATYFNECEGAVQDLELNEAVT